MDERIRTFTDELLKQLAGLPEDEIQEAAGFYEEYLSEALDAGKDLDWAISDIGTPDRIAAVIKAETSIAKARTNPGIRNFNSSFTSAFKLVTAPLSIFSLSLTALVSYSMVAVLFGGALVTALSALIIFCGMTYEAFRIPLKFFPSAIGAVGSGLVAAGICLIVAFCLFKLGKLFIRFSTNLIRRMLRLSGRDVPEISDKRAKKTGLRTVPVLLSVAAAGFILFAVSGLPQTYFTIFNSMSSAEEKSVSYEYDIKGIRDIAIDSANSKIRVERTHGDKIAISYDQPLWMDHDIGNEAGVLEFKEKSSGMLPLFRLVILHEGMSEIKVLLPDGYSPEDLSLKSTGGHITVNGLYGSVTAKTSNGNITLNTSGAYGPFNITAVTFNGILQIGEKKFYKQQNKGPGYWQKGTSGKLLQISSSGGNVVIK